MITTYLTQQVQCVGVSDYGDGKYEIQFADGTTRLATNAEVLAAAKAAKKAQIKTAARAQILARYPEWMQANLTARAVELVSLGQTTGPEWGQMQAIWDWIKATRARSNLLEADVDACTTVEVVEQLTIGGWPD
jgi:hypothetical protein